MKPRKINSGDSKIRILEFRRDSMESGELRRAKLGQKKSRMYFFLRGEGLFENLLNRRFRPHVEYRKIAGDIFEQLGLDPKMKFHWDRYAGCAMCPCSPGFVLEGDFNHDIFVDYAIPSQVTELDGFVLVNKKEEPAPETFEGFVINDQVTENIVKVSEPKTPSRDSRGRFLKEVSA